MRRYARAADLGEALAVLADAGPARPALLAGGTDLLPPEPTARTWLAAPPTADILDIGGLSALRGVAFCGDGVRLGALTTWTDVLEAPLPPAFDALRAAAGQVGGRQIQNRGTIGGNLCNASPAADGAPPLLILDAEVELASLRGVRRMPLEAFILGPRRTALAPDELLTAVVVPAPPAELRSCFHKLGARRYLVISIVSVAAAVMLGTDGRIAEARLALGACSPAPLRLRRLEAELVGQYPAEAAVALGETDGLAPIDDVRATAAYRRSAAETLIRRALADLATTVRRAA